jgi:PAS domain S-box-containing protein
MNVEDQLSQSEERFRLLMEAIPDYAIYILDPTGNVTTCNQGAAQITGYSAHEIVGRNFSLLFTHEDERSGRPQRELERAKLDGRYEEQGWRVRKDGSNFWAGVVVTAMRDRGGLVIGFTKVARDLTAHKEAERSADRLASERAAREFAESAESRLRDSEARFRSESQRLEIILEGLADGVAAQNRQGQLIFANKGAAVAMGFPSVEACMAATVQERADRFELFHEDGAPVQVRELPGQRVLQGEPACSMLVHVRDRDTGQEWWRDLRATPVFGQDGQPELAIYIWHDVTEARRREQHESYLARATAALAESLDYESTLSTLASLLVPGLGDWCSIHLRQGNLAPCVAVSHVDPDKVQFAREVERRYPPDPQQQRGMWNVLRTGSSELYAEISAELLAQGAQDAEHLRILREAGLRSALIVPIRTRQRVVGTLSLISAHPGRRYNQHDLSLAEELGRRAGSAIENARLYAAQKKAREDLALLARAGDSFSSAASYEELLHCVVCSALPALGDFAIFQLAEGNAVRSLAVAHEDPKLDALLKTTSWAHSDDGASELSALLRACRRYVPFVDDAWLQHAGLVPEVLQALRRLSLCSLISVPVRTRERVLGSLTVCHGKSARHHGEEDVGLLEELARRAAISISQAQLHTRAQEAAKSAQEANRLKDEFLATVSHELRTPLNAILGWASVLRTRSREPALAKPVEIIHRNALAQAKIIDDILDASRVIAGKLRLDLKETDLANIVRDSIDVLRPSITAKQIDLEFVPALAHCLLVADPDRLQQVVWNVLSNAVKFSEAGGNVLISLAHQGEAWVLSVRDSGCGITPEFLPFVFDRFKQADGSTTRRVGGLGLGLAIVRHIVELHGGHVEATSPGVGQGATVRVTLPVRALTSSPKHEQSVPGQNVMQAPGSRGGRVLEGMRVLVVDDEEDIRELLLTALCEAGALVESAASAAEGFAALQRFRPQVLVSDIGMPEEDGYSLVQRVRALQSAAGGDIPALALTAYSRGPDQDRALWAGFNMHLSKPVVPDELIAAITALVAPERKPHGP